MSAAPPSTGRSQARGALGSAPSARRCITPQAAATTSSGCPAQATTPWWPSTRPRHRRPEGARHRRGDRPRVRAADPWWRSRLPPTVPGDRSQHRRTGRSSADGAGTGPHHAPSDAHPRRRAQSCGACSMDPVHPLRHRRSPRRGTDRPLVTVRPCPERSRTMKPFPGAQLRRRPADAPDADAPEPDHPARAHEQQQTDGAQGGRWLSCGGRVPAGRACKALATFLASPCGHRFSGDPVGRPILGVVRAARFGTSHLGRPNGDGEEPALLGARLGVTFSVTMATFRDIRLWLRGSRRSSRRPLLCA